MNKMHVIVVLVSLFAVGCPDPRIAQLMDQVRELHALRYNDAEQQHQNGYGMGPTVGGVNPAAANAPVAGQPPQTAPSPQMGARTTYAPQTQTMIVPNMRPVSLTGGVLGGMNDHSIDDGRYYHLRVFPGHGVGVVVETATGVNLPIEGGALAMLDTNGQRVYVVPGAEDGRPVTERNVWFAIVRRGSINVRCVQMPAPEVQAAGMFNALDTIGPVHTFTVDSNHTFGSIDMGACGG